MENEKLMDEVTTEEVSQELEAVEYEDLYEEEESSKLAGIAVGVVGTLVGVAVYKYGKPMVAKIVGKFKKSETANSEEIDVTEVIDVEEKD